MARRDMPDSETVELDGVLIETQPIGLVGQKFLDLVALIALELDHFAHSLGLGVRDDRAIASEFLLDDLENFLVVKLGGDALDSGQGLASIALLNTNVDVFLLLGLRLSGILIGFGEGVVGLEIFDGHKLDFLALSLGNGSVRGLVSRTGARRVRLERFHESTMTEVVHL